MGVGSKNIAECFQGLVGNIIALPARLRTSMHTADAAYDPASLELNLDWTSPLVPTFNPQDTLPVDKRIIVNVLPPNHSTLAGMTGQHRKKLPSHGICSTQVLSPRITSLITFECQ